MTPQIDIKSLRSQLLNATIKLSKLQLLQASKWSAEALNGLQSILNDLLHTHDPSIAQPTAEDITDETAMLLAQSYFGCKEFERAARVLEDCKTGDAKFLRLYSLMMSIDKRSYENSDGLIIGGNSNGTNSTHIPPEMADNHLKSNATESNQQLDSRLTDILIESEEFLATKSNAFLYYLNGLVHRRKKLLDAAQRNLYKSLVEFPFNWSCWKELIETFPSFEDARNFVLRAAKRSDTICETVMFQFFEMVILQEAEPRLPRLGQLIEGLEEVFPKFTFIKEVRFLTLYKNLQYYEAEAVFDDILIEDPSRLDGLDNYSNMLYVMEKKSKLSFLAHYASELDKFRPETCCVLANYYSINGEHEKAIMYYRRALILDKTCLSAWTLMGHEFVELKNSHAAIESYRRAVDINPKDYRAWYGLGQAYEVLDMHLYALYYYRKATNLQPLDQRMWQAMGNCYEKINQLENAFKSFYKALGLGRLSAMDADNNSATGQGSNEGLTLGDVRQESIEPHIPYRLAIILEKLGDQEATEKYMEFCSSQDKHWFTAEECPKAKIWLAKNALKRGDPQRAYDLAKDLNYTSSQDMEEARAIARDARNRMTR